MDAADGATSVFLQQGVLGAVAVVCMVAIAYLFKTLMNANTARVADLMNFKDTVIEQTAAIRELSNALRSQTERLDRLERR